MRNMQPLNGRHLAGVFAALFVASFLLVLPGCRSPLDPPATGGDATGILSLTLNRPVADGRTIMPDYDPAMGMGGFARFRITFTAAPGTPVATIPPVIWNAGQLTGGTGPRITLPVGSWSMIVTAYASQGGEYHPVAGASRQVSVASGAITEADVVLVPIPGAGTGTFEWALTWDSGITGVMEIRQPNGAPLNPPMVFDIAGFSNHNIDLPVGEYLVVFSLDNGGETGIVSEILRVYWNRTSRAVRHFDDRYFPVSLLDIILRSWDSATNTWGLISAGIEARHFTVFGIQDMFNWNFLDMVDRFNYLTAQNLPHTLPTCPASLAVLVDATLMSFWPTVLSSNFVTQAAATAYLEAFSGANNTPVSAVTWPAYNVANVMVGPYIVTVNFNQPLVVSVNLTAPIPSWLAPGGSYLFNITTVPPDANWALSSFTSWTVSPANAGSFGAAGFNMFTVADNAPAVEVSFRATVGTTHPVQSPPVYRYIARVRNISDVVRFSGNMEGRPLPGWHTGRGVQGHGPGNPFYVPISQPGANWNVPRGNTLVLTQFNRTANWNGITINTGADGLNIQQRDTVIFRGGVYFENASDNARMDLWAPDHLNILPVHDYSITDTTGWTDFELVWNVGFETDIPTQLRLVANVMSGNQAYAHTLYLRSIEVIGAPLRQGFMRDFVTLGDMGDPAWLNTTIREGDSFTTLGPFFISESHLGAEWVANPEGGLSLRVNRGVGDGRWNGLMLDRDDTFILPGDHVTVVMRAYSESAPDMWRAFRFGTSHGVPYPYSPTVGIPGYATGMVGPATLSTTITQAFIDNSMDSPYGYGFRMYVFDWIGGADYTYHMTIPHFYIDGIIIDRTRRMDMDLRFQGFQDGAPTEIDDNLGDIDLLDDWSRITLWEPYRFESITWLHDGQDVTGEAVFAERVPDWLNPPNFIEAHYTLTLASIHGNRLGTHTITVVVEVDRNGILVPYSRRITFRLVP